MKTENGINTAQGYINISNKVYLSRDPFAREDFVRVNVTLPVNTALTCDYCGAPGKLHKDHRTLYRYGSESDNYKLSLCRGLLCSVGCYRAYYL